MIVHFPTHFVIDISSQKWSIYLIVHHSRVSNNSSDLLECQICFFFGQTPVLGLGLGVDFTFAWDNDNDNNDNNNPHLNFVKGTVLGDKEQGVGIRDKG